MLFFVFADPCLWSLSFSPHVFYCFLLNSSARLYLWGSCAIGLKLCFSKAVFHLLPLDKHGLLLASSDIDFQCERFLEHLVSLNLKPNLCKAFPPSIQKPGQDRKLPYHLLESVVDFFLMGVDAITDPGFMPASHSTFCFTKTQSLMSYIQVGFHRSDEDQTPALRTHTQFTRMSVHAHF